MSDSRFLLKVDFQVYGKKYTWNSSLNWTASPGQCDERIIEWFVDCYEQAFLSHTEKMRIESQKQQEKINKEHEIAELKRLAQKYPHVLDTKFFN